ncbi:MAG: hypothetical protein ABIT05_12790 [Chitinophagaceae bacterium]
MKNLWILSLIALLAGCSKESSAPEVVKDTAVNKPEVCEFGASGFNLSKRAPVEVVKEKRPTGGGGGATPPPPPANASVILLDFDGQLVSGTSWNAGVAFNCLPANLASSAIAQIVDRVTNDYSPFNIVVTTDETVYNAAVSTRRMRVIFTESWEWFGQAGGTSFLNSFTWGNNTPCFVFSSLLGYNEKQIAEAASHEAGHTFGLRHQATYNGTTLVSEYNYGGGAGEMSWAPIMGCGYYKNLTTWHNGPNSISSTSFQNDVAVIGAITGLKNDDYSNTSSGAQALSSSLTGTINSTTDTDFFTINLAAPKTLSLVPFNVGGLNEGANLDMVAKIYNSQGQLINTVEDPTTLNAISLVNTGQYYIAVSVTPNPNAGIYGMLANYKISLN